MNRWFLRVSGIALGAGLLVGCDIWDPKTTKLQYMPDMADAPTVKAQEGFINPPDFSVPTTGILYPDSFEVAETEFQNPYPKNDHTLAKGKELFDTYCLVCHGPDGKGQGTLGTSYPMAVPDISRPDLAQRKDGFFFLRITKGGGMMPSYGHATSPNERWLMIHYLRTLQGV